MTELLSQAYSHGNGIFKCPPWMKILTRDPEDALSIQTNRKTGGINVIDLANINSCSFIATQDLGNVNTNDSFEIIEHPDKQERGGAGIQAVEYLIKKGVGSVIVPEMGPNAERVLRSANISVFQGEFLPARELIEKWKNKSLKEI